MTDEQLQELSDLATKAISVGTWSAYGPALIGVNADDPKGEEEAIDIVPECFESESPFMFYANCQYIAAACNAVPALIADLRRLRELERACRAMREFRPLTIVWRHNYATIGRLLGMREAESE